MSDTTIFRMPIMDMLKPGLVTRDVLLDLLDKGEMLRKLVQTRTRLAPRTFDPGPMKVRRRSRTAATNCSGRV